MGANSTVEPAPTMDELRTRARQWFAAHAREFAGDRADDLDVAVFHDMEPDDERALLDRIRNWHQRKWDAGLAGIDWPTDLGGWGLSPQHADAVEAAEAELVDLPTHELFNVTVHLVAPTIRLLGTASQQTRWAAAFARAELLCVQLFSEPGAGSDLAGLGTRAVRHGAEWVVNGQKVWSSGAHLSDWGILIARTDDSVVKHAGMTAFLVPMDAPGVTVRPLRQMSGGTSFCEVFLDDVRLDDTLRLGAEGDGWKVATTTLNFERDTSGGDTRTGGSWPQVLALARALSRADDPSIRPRLADVYIRHRLAQVAAARDLLAREEGRPRGPEGSLRKLQWVNGLMQVSDVVTNLLGPPLIADTGEQGTFAWTAHVLGAPGYRIAGGTDEIQRTIIAERLLGLPSGLKADRGLPWKEVPR